MKNKEVLVVPTSALGKDSLWAITWLHVEKIAPSIKSEVFPDQASEQKELFSGENESGTQETG